MRVRSLPRRRRGSWRRRRGTGLAGWSTWSRFSRWSAWWTPSMWCSSAGTREGRRADRDDRDRADGVDAAGLGTRAHQGRGDLEFRVAGRVDAAADATGLGGFADPLGAPGCGGARFWPGKQSADREARAHRSGCARAIAASSARSAIEYGGGAFAPANDVARSPGGPHTGAAQAVQDRPVGAPGPGAWPASPVAQNAAHCEVPSAPDELVSGVVRVPSFRDDGAQDVELRGPAAGQDRCHHTGKPR
jgi:hypothetical protein